MTDKEKITKALEYLNWHFTQDDGMADKDAVKAWEVLLREQEAVKPTLIREGRNKNYNDYVCPRCDNEVVYEQNYCSECGVQFLWEGSVKCDDPD